MASIVALGKAAERATECLSDEATQVRAMRDRFENGILETVSGASVNGAGADRLPNTSNFSFDGIESGARIDVIGSTHNICCSAGSACRTGSGEGSHVLRACMGTASVRKVTSVFLSGRWDSDADVDKALEIVPQVIEKLRRLNSPVASYTRNPRRRQYADREELASCSPLSRLRST